METLSLFTGYWGHFDGSSHQNVTGAVSSLLCDGSMTSGLCNLSWVRCGVTWLLLWCGHDWPPVVAGRWSPLINTEQLSCSSPAPPRPSWPAVSPGDGESRRPPSVARARGLARLRAHYGGTPAEAGPHTAQHTPALHRHLITTTPCTVQLETKVAEDFKL